MRALWVVMLAGITAAPASGAVLSTSKTWPARGVEAIRIDFSAGDLEIVAADSDEIEVTMRARCHSSGRCEERARRLRLVSDHEDGVLTFKLEGQEKNLPRKPSVSLTFRVPRDLDVRVHMGAGDVEIGGVQGNVKLRMGAGDVEIRKGEDTVKTVDVHVGVGDATLRVGSRRVPGRGFVSKHLNWSDGAGHGRVDVDLGAGDVTVSLD